jgi:hypothetical protein
MLAKNFNVTLIRSKPSHNLKVLLNKAGLCSTNVFIGYTYFFLACDYSS